MEAMGIIFSNIYDNNMGELTSERTSASIPFGSRYRQIDFALSNMANSKISNIGIEMCIRDSSRSAAERAFRFSPSGCAGLLRRSRGAGAYSAAAPGRSPEFPSPCSLRRPSAQ